MVGKNNFKYLREKQANKVYTYAIKRLSIGVASVAVGVGLFFSEGVSIVSANEISETTVSSFIEPSDQETDLTLEDNQKNSEAEISESVPETVETSYIEKSNDSVTNEDALTNQSQSQIVEYSEEGLTEAESLSKDSAMLEEGTSTSEKVNLQDEASDINTISEETEFHEITTIQDESIGTSADNNNLASEEPVSLSKEDIISRESTVEDRDIQAQLEQIAPANLAITELSEAQTNSQNVVGSGETEDAVMESASIETAVNKTGNNVNSQINVTDINFKINNAADTKVNVSAGGYLQLSTNFNITGDVKSGDYFAIKYGQNIRPGSITQPVQGSIKPITDSNEQIIAQGVWEGDSNSVIYTFTSWVNNMDKIQGYIIQDLEPNRKTVTDDNVSYPVSVTIGDLDYSDF